MAGIMGAPQEKAAWLIRATCKWYWVWSGDGQLLVTLSLCQLTGKWRDALQSAVTSPFDRRAGTPSLGSQSPAVWFGCHGLFHPWAPSHSVVSPER